MRSTIVAAAFAAVAAAKPIAQNMDWDFLETVSAMPTTGTVTVGMAETVSRKSQSMF